MFNRIDWLAHLEHRNDLLREAEKGQMSLLVPSSRPAWFTRVARKPKKSPRTQWAIRRKPVTSPCCEAAAA